MIQQQQQQKQLKKQKVIKTFKILSNKQETHQHIKGEKKKKLCGSNKNQNNLKKKASKNENQFLQKYSKEIFSF